MPAHALPLLRDAAPGCIVAWRGGAGLTQAQMGADVAALAAGLADGAAPLLNLCRDRYAFALGLLAAAAAGRETLLPSAVAPQALSELARAQAAAGVLADDAAPQVPGLQRIAVPEFIGCRARLPVAAGRPLAGIEFERVLARIFTSGSTGVPQPHAKTFGRVVSDAHSLAGLLWPIAGAPCSVLGTVPSQHMFGLETAVLLPLVGAGVLAARQPFFPADIAQALAELPAPRLLVSTPFHLRTLLDARVALPPLAAVLCSTATLPAALAQEVEQRLAAPLIEIYGSTETGQLAHRRTALEQDWQPAAGIELTLQGDAAWARGGHLEAAYRLNDTLEFTEGGRFRLLGRAADLVNVAGKRSSLAFLNAVLTGLPGVKDGVFWRPPAGAAGDLVRLAAFAVAPAMTRRQVLDGLRARLDPVFLPRPLVLLEALPRNETGKLSAQALEVLWARHRGGGGVPPAP